MNADRSGFVGSRGRGRSRGWDSIEKETDWDTGDDTNFSQPRGRGRGRKEFGSVSVDYSENNDTTNWRSNETISFGNRKHFDRQEQGRDYRPRGGGGRGSSQRGGSSTRGYRSRDGGGGGSRGGYDRGGFDDFDRSRGRSGQGRYSSPEPKDTPYNNSSTAPSKRIDWGSIHANRAKHEAEKWQGLPEILKVFYKEHPDISRMSQEQVLQHRLDNHGILVSDLTDQNRPIPNPVTDFIQAFTEYPDILAEIEKLGFDKPTPIQSQAWPILMQGHDLVGIAQTGTGKTLAFLLPALIHIAGQPQPLSERIGPSALILSPTRELALQIEKEVKKFSYRGIKSVCVYGGASRREQVNIVSKGVEIVIATPGRLSDLQENQILNLKGVTYLVLDEADRMLDMGFEPQIKKVLLDIRPNRQTVMTSATWPPGVRRLINAYMKEGPFQVTVGSLDLRACALVEQKIEFIEDDFKKARTMDFISQMKPGEKVLIFCSRKSTADDLASDLLLHRFPVQSIHGDREQSDREQALDDFITGLAPILVATDVASRGLDIKDITYVVNYDFPVHIEDYVHRVGRTGRAGARGKSLTFMSRSNWRWAGELVKILAEADQDVPDELVSMAERYEKNRESRNRDRHRY